ncbi:cellulose biosynthesis protein BcsF [Bordetella sp. 2513F-2]
MNYVDALMLVLLTCLVALPAGYLLRDLTRWAWRMAESYLIPAPNLRYEGVRRRARPPAKPEADA